MMLNMIDLTSLGTVDYALYGMRRKLGLVVLSRKLGVHKNIDETLKHSADSPGIKAGYFCGVFFFHLQNDVKIQCSIKN